MLFLDDNPIMCVNNTPVSLFAHILTSIKSGYGSLLANPTSFNKTTCKEIEDLEDLIIKDILFSKKNRDWIVQYFNSMSSIYQKISGENYGSISADFNPVKNKDKYFTRPLKIHLPTFDKMFEKLVEENSAVYFEITDPILLSRTILIDLQPTEDEFVQGIPDWLSNIEGMGFSAFDPITKKHIKIVRVNDNYKYFISKISDNWQEITDVPKDMQYIINYLIRSRQINFD